MKKTTKCNYDPAHIILYITGDMEDKDRDAFKQHLLRCASCNSQYQSLHKESLDFQNKYPFHKIKTDQAIFEKREIDTDKVHNYHVHSLKPPHKNRMNSADNRSVEKKGNIIRAIFFTSRTFYALAASLIIIVTGSFYFRSSNVVQSKGKPFLTLYKKEADNSITTGKNNNLSPGVSIQFTYTVMNDSYFSLYSINEQGKVSKLYPEEGNSAIYLQKNSNTPIPLSFKLDNYIGLEYYIGVFSKKNYLTADMMNLISQEYEKYGSLETMSLNDSSKFTFSLIRTKKVQDVVN